MDRQYKIIESQARADKFFNVAKSNIISYSVFSTLVAPLFTLGTSLQLSPMHLEKFYETTTTEITKLQLAKSLDLVVKEQKFNELQLFSGMVGTNKPFRAPYYTNYRQAALALSAQGFQGFYKGNLTEIIRFSLGIVPKLYIFSMDSVQTSSKFSKFFIFFATDYFVDVVLQPLQNARTRLILQNRIPEFRVYPSLYKLMTRVDSKELLQGYNVIFPKKALIFASMLYMPTNPVANVCMASIVQLMIYPLETAQRRLEAQSTEHSMLPRRYLSGVRWTLSRIYHEEGIFKGLYRGFFCNSIACFGRMVVYPGLALSLMHQKEEYGFIDEGWGLIN